MIRDYYVPIPPHLFDVLQEIGNTSSEDFDAVIDASRTQLFNFLYPVPVADKEALEKFIMNRFILRRVGSGNIRKWRQMFKAKILEIMPFYSMLMESEHLSYDPLINNDLTTTDDAADTLDTTRDKRTDNDYTYSKSGTTHSENAKDGSTTGEYEKAGENETVTDKDGTTSGQYSKSGSETGNERELNRYLDTPQGDSSRVWETDAQGHVVLSDYYITDVRGITKDASRSWSETGSDSGTSTEDTTVNGTYSEDGSDSGTSHEESTTQGTYSESGSDQRDIVEHETIDTDTTHTNENYKLGVSGISKSKLLLEYRETFLRIYTNIAEELEPLFYNLVEVDDILDFV